MESIATIFVTIFGLEGVLPYPIALGIVLLLSLGWFWLLHFVPIFFRLIILISQVVLATATLSITTVLTNADSRIILIDEFVAVPVIFTFLYTQWLKYPVLLGMSGIVLFAILDSLKPFGLDMAEVLPGAYGVVIDDILVGLTTSIIMAMILYLLKVNQQNYWQSSTNK